MRRNLSPSANLTFDLSPKRFISDLEIERSYGIPRKTLQNWRVLGRGPTYRKFGKSVRYDVRMLEDYLETLPYGGEGIPAAAVRSGDM
jgi:hypothetical protein